MAGSSTSSSAALPPSLIASAQAPTPSSASAQLPNLPLGSCPGGTTLQEVSFTDCYPPPNPPQGPACSTLLDLDWGGLGVPGSLLIPKFDATLGSLQKVELEYISQYVGDVCIDNPQAACCSAAMGMQFQSLASGVNNAPQLPPTADVIQFNDFVDITPVGFRLGPDDGVADCPTPQSPNANGQCTQGSPGADHFQSSWDSLFPPLLTTVDQPGDLAPFIMSSGFPTDIMYSVDAQSLVNGSICIAALPFITTTAKARVELKVTYTYCPNIPPTCQAPAQTIEVDENPVAASNSVQINLMELVTDINGCIDCSQFEITQQPSWGEPLPQFPCSGSTLTGDLHSPSPSCTGCTSCMVTYTPIVGADFMGMDTFTFRAVDDQGASTECTVNVTVNPVNEPPVCIPGILPSVCEDDTILIDLTQYVMDPDDGPDGLPGTADDENCGWGIDYSTLVPTSDCNGVFTAIPGVPGSFRFKPPFNECGICTISFDACDTGPGEEQLCISDSTSGNGCSIEIEVKAKNQRPNCIPGPGLPDVCEGGTVDIDFRAFVRDPDDTDGCGAGLDDSSITPSVGSGDGSFAPTAGMPAGWWTYTAPLDRCGPVSISLNASDLGQTNGCPPGGALSLLNPCQLSLNILPVNEPPVFVGGTLPDICEGGTVDIDFRAFVSDPDDADGCGAGLDASSITPSVGSGDGSFAPTAGMPAGWWTYTAPPDWCGPVSVSLSASDLGQTNGCPPTGVLSLPAPGQFSLTVLPVNEPPVCVGGDLPDICEGGTLDIDFRAFVRDPDDSDGCGAGLDASSITPSVDPGDGSFAPTAGMPAGWWTYTAPLDKCGPVSVSLDASDLGQTNGCPPSGVLSMQNPCQLSLSILPVNEPPVFVGGNLPELCEGGTVDIDFRAFVSDPDDSDGCGAGLDTSSITPSVGSGDGFFAPTAGMPAGWWTYTAPPDWCGPVSVSLNASDLGQTNGCPPDGVLSLLAPGQFSLTVLPINEPPVCVGGDLPDTCEGGTVDIDFRAFVRDPDDADGCGAGLDASSITPSVAPGDGSFAPTAGMPTGWWTYTAPLDRCGPVSVSMDASDLGQTNGCPPNGALSLLAPCQLSLTILPVNEPPVFVGGTLPDICEGGTVDIDFRAFVSDPDDADGCGAGLDVSSITPSVAPGDGSLAPTASMPAGCWTYTAPQDWCGPISISMDASDLGQTNGCLPDGVLSLPAPGQFTLTVLPINEQPICLMPPPFTVPQGQTISIDFQTFVSDPDDADGCGAGLDVSSITPNVSTGYGSFMASPGMPLGWFDYTAPLDKCGLIEVSVNACDMGVVDACNPVAPLFVSTTCSFEINVTRCNSAPICVAGPPICVPEDSIEFPIDLKAFVTDPDDDGSGCAPTIGLDGYSAVASCGKLSNAGGGMFIFTPPEDYCGPCQITLVATDAGGVQDCGDTTSGPLSVECAIDVCITPVNDPPVAVDDSFATTEGIPILVDLCANDYDPEGLLPDNGSCGCSLDCDSITIDDPIQAGGTLEPDPDGSGRFLFTPASDFVNDECCFTYTIWDNCANVSASGCAAGACSEDLQPKADQGQVCISVQPCVDTNLRTAASLLLFPEYDNRPGFDSIHTVTNTHDQKEIWLEFQFVDGEDCARSDRAHLLTPGDTYSFVTRDFLSDLDRGYSYVYATCGPNGEPVAFNHLIGNQIVLDGQSTFAYGVNAIGFQGIENPGATITPCGLFSTEQSNDTVRNFDGIEYNPTPDRIYIPRFLGQTDIFQSELILIGLSGGKKFDTSLDLIIFNDNEEDFSAELTFYCWESVSLMDITNLFSNEYLAYNTDNDPDELFGNPTIETGWIVLDGAVATSTHASIMDPAFYAILIDHTGPDQQAADIPWSVGCQTNGGLLPVSVHGDY